MRAPIAVAFGLLILGGASSASTICNTKPPNQTPTTRYDINVIRGEVFDKNTKLTWQLCSVGQTWKSGAGCVGVIKKLTWNEAMGLVGGAWHVPTKDELTTLISTTCDSPVFFNKEVFPDMNLDNPWWWTSTPYGDSRAWAIDFIDGSPGGLRRTDAYAVRFVR